MPFIGNKVADVAVTVGQGVIDASHIQDASITTADIGNDAITPNKVDDDGTGFQMGSLGLGTAVSGSEKLTVGGTASFSGDITGTLATAAQTNITSVGTLSSLDVSGAITAGTSFTLDNASGSGVIRSQSSANNTVDLTASSGGDAFIEASDTSQIKIGHASGTKLIIDTHANSGRVGIGVSPTTKFEVQDGNAIPLRFGDVATTPSATAGYIGMSTSAYSGNNGDLVLIPRTSASSDILLMEANVGINKTNPSGLLEIKGASDNQLFLDSNSTSANTGLFFKENGVNKWEVYHRGATNDFRIYNYANSNADFAITSGGSIGINQTSPDAKLHIKGDAKIVNIETTSTIGRCYIMFEDPSANKGFIGYGSSQTDVLSIYNYKNNGLSFGAGGSEVMTIDTNGNLAVTGNTKFNNTITHYGDKAMEIVKNGTTSSNGLAVSFDITLKSPSTLWTSVVVELLITTIGNSHPTASSIYLVEIEHHSTGGMTIATPVYIGGTGSQTITTSNPSTNVAQIRIFGQGGSTSNVGAICRVVSGVTGISSIA